MKSLLKKDKVPVECTRPDPLPDGTYCHYSWETKSKLHRLSCPDCGYPNNREKAMARAAETAETAEEDAKNGTE